MFNSALLLAAEEGAENAFWLPHDINEVWWGSVAFLIVIFILWKFGRTTVSGYFSGRITKVSEELDAAAQTRIAAESKRDDIKSALADSDSEAARIIAEARTSADQLAIDISARTESDIAGVRERAVTDLASARSQAESDLRGELSRLSLGAAELVVERSLDADSQQRLIDDYISQVGSQN